MEKSIKLNIISPGRESIAEEVVSIITTETDGRVEFLANHAPSIVATIPTVTTFTTVNGNNRELFTSSGIVYIRNNIINFCCDSFNFPEEIDRERANKALERAEGRLKKKDNVDIERAKKALARAKARLQLK